MNLLYGKTKTKEEKFSYQINSGGDLSVKEGGTITITFRNEKFYEATFPFSGRYTRNGWMILAQINEEIREIEANYANQATKSS